MYARLTLVYTLVITWLAKIIFPYLHLGIGPARNLDNHIAHRPITISVERNIMEWRHILVTTL